MGQAPRATPLLKVDIAFIGWILKGRYCQSVTWFPASTFLPFVFQDKRDDSTAYEAKVSIHDASKVGNGRAWFRRQLLVPKSPSPVCQIDFVFQKEPQSGLLYEIYQFLKTSVGLIQPVGHQFESLYFLACLILRFHICKRNLKWLNIWVFWHNAYIWCPPNILLLSCFLLWEFITPILPLCRDLRSCVAVSLAAWMLRMNPRYVRWELEVSHVLQTHLFGSESSCWMLRLC